MSASEASVMDPEDNILPESFQVLNERKRKLTDDAMEIAEEVDDGASKTTCQPSQKRKKGSHETRKISVPPHRYSSLKENWMKIFTPIVEHLKLQIRFNMKSRQVEIRVGPATESVAHLQRAADFVKAFLCGFDVDDALAIVRLENIFLESFQIKDVKTLRGAHMSRAIGRLAGKGGRTKFTIENTTKTRIVLADSKIHILGNYDNLQLARRAICNLILGSPPSKVYGNLRSVASRMSERL